MTDAPQLRRIEHDGWLELRLDRPAKLNALTPELLFELAAELGRPGNAAVVGLTASGDRAFSAGFDLDVLRELGPAAHAGDPLGTATSALRACPVPTVAALHGYCWGAAVELVTACDVRLGTADLSLKVPANRLGSVYRPAGIAGLARRYGPTTTVELLAFGMTFDATAAYERGVISAVVDDPVSHIDQLAVGAVGPAAGQHAHFVREWMDTPEDERDAFLARWTAVRDAAVSQRSVPPPPGRSA